MTSICRPKQSNFIYMIHNRLQQKREAAQQIISRILSINTKSKEQNAQTRRTLMARPTVTDLPLLCSHALPAMERYSDGVEHSFSSTRTKS